MTKLLGISVNANVPVLSITPGRSAPGIGMRTGSEPTAKIIQSAVSVLLPTCIVWASLTIPRPRYTATPLAFKRPSTPPTNVFTIEPLYCCALAQSTSIPETVMPNLADCSLMALNVELTWISAFVGIQPTLRQVPPTLSASIRETLAPIWAALIAVTYPPGPAPTIRMLFCPDAVAVCAETPGTTDEIVGATTVSSAGAGATCSPGCPITPITDFTGPDSPSCIIICRRTPSSCASTTLLILSVSTSTTPSPFVTGSPTFFSHCETVPSVIVRPNCGIVRLVAMKNYLLMVK